MWEIIRDFLGYSRVLQWTQTDWDPWEFNLGETTFLKSLECLEHTLKSKHFLGQLLDVHAELLNVLFNVYGRHLVLI